MAARTLSVSLNWGLKFDCLVEQASLLVLASEIERFHDVSGKQTYLCMVL